MTVNNPNPNAGKDEQTRHLVLGDFEGMTAKPDAQAYYNQSWAVVIGINDYQDQHPRLAHAKNDAEAVARTLIETYGFEHVFTLYDQEATGKAILGWLRDELPRQVGRNDRVVLFFAGHGTTREGGRGYLIPYGAQYGKYADYVDMSELHGACEWIKAKHILIILDCCFSGVAAVASRAAPPIPPKLLTDVYLQRITEQNAWQILTAGASDELAADSGTRPGHSAFTSALLAGLEGQGDENEDGIITASELANFVKPEVTRDTFGTRSKGQTPFFNYLAGSGQGDFVFLRPDQEIKIQPASVVERELQPLLKTYPWLWAVGAGLLIVIAMLAWFALKGTQASRTVEVKFAAVAATATQWAVDAQATLAAAHNVPGPTQTAISGQQTADFNKNATVWAATLTVIAAMGMPQPSPTGTPTAAPSPSPTYTPTVKPSPAPSATQTPNQAATTVAFNAQATQTIQARAAETAAAVLATCPDGPQGEFRDIWDKYKGRLGCPRQVEPTIYGNFAEQQFENGFMFWSEFLDFVVAVTDGENPTWFSVKRTWSFVPNGAECAGQFPQGPGQIQPINAFGGVWCDNSEIREAIGWAVSGERGMGGGAQEFDGGLILRNDDQSKIYVLFSDAQTYIREQRP